ncbi:MAG: discoidin domain-containing protein [Magnetococcus sp. YQC-9]
MPHRYWRLLLTQSTSGPDLWLALSELQLRLDGGSVNLGPLATPSGNHYPTDLPLLFDDNPNTWWSNDGTGETSWMQFDFGAATPVALGELWFKPSSVDQCPSAFTCQWSDDGQLWYDQGVFLDVTTDWVEGAWRVFPLPVRTSGQASATQPWQARIEAWRIQPLADTIARACRALWSLRSVMGRALIQPRADSVSRTQQRLLAFDLLDRNPIRAALQRIWQARTPDTPLLIPFPRIRLDGRDVELISATLSWSPQQVPWMARLVVAHDAGFHALPVAQPVTFDWDGVAFRMIIIGKAIGWSQAGHPERVISAVGVAARHALPFAQPLSRVWEQPVTAREAVEQALNEPVVWNLPDWLIPANRLHLDGEPALALVERLAQAVGGVVRSRPDGRLIVAPRYPRPLPEWEQLVPDHRLNDFDHLIIIREGEPSGSGIDRVTVQEGVEALQPPGLWLELDAESAENHRIAPDRTVRLLTLASPGVAVEALSATSGTLMPSEPVTRTRIETLRFPNSRRAVLPRPVLRIEAVTWSGLDLGPLTLEADGRTVTAAITGTALAQVTVTLATQGCRPLKLPAIAEGSADFSALVFARGAVMPAMRREVVMSRGTGGREQVIISPLLTDHLARRLRAEAELDAGERVQRMRLTVVHRPEMLPGEMIAVEDGWQGAGYRAMVTGITHEIDRSGAFTHLDAVRSAR